MAVQLLDLNAQYETIRCEIRAAIDEVLDAQHFILGPKVMGFERDCESYLRVPHALGVSSGSDALLLALMALGIGPGDKVITTPFSFFATAGAIARLGGTPVFVDIDPATYNICPESIEVVLKDMGAEARATVRAIIPVHLYGQMTDMDRIMKIADAYGLYVIEDAAQAFGAETVYRGGVHKAGTIGHIGCYSFFPSKNLGGYGDGGMVTTKDPELFEKMRILRVHGSSPKYYHQVIGGNFRLDELQAAVLRVKLKYLDQWSSGRQVVASWYREMLSQLNQVSLPQRVRDIEFGHIYHQYVISCGRRDELKALLHDANIGSAVYYPVPLHLQKCFAYLGYNTGSMPESEKAAGSVLALPIYPELKQIDVEEVSGLIKQFTEGIS